MKKVYLLVATVVLVMSSCKTSKYADLADGLYADIQTTKGDILIKLEYEKTPITVANFVSLAEGKNKFVKEELKDKKYYDGLIFHRVMKDFMIQGGCPDGNGTGNPGYKFMDEFNDSLVHDKKGILSMANSGPSTNGSQFFITHKPTPWLDGVHSVFGEVVAGMNVLDSIANVKVASGNKPVDEIQMNTVSIIRNGKAAKKFDAVDVITDYFENEEERLAKLEQEAAAEKAKAEKVKADYAAKFTESKKNAKTMPSGLQLLVLKEGTGEKPKIGQKVKIDYAGWLENGTLFDTSLGTVATDFGMFDQILKMHRGNLTPIECNYSPEERLAPGFREAMLTMKVGDKVRAFIPPHLGYGEQGGGPIPPNATLIFDLELTEVIK